MQPDSDPFLRIRRLRVQGDAAAIQELIALLGDADWAGNAAIALTQLNAEAAVPEIIRRFEAADDPDERRFWIDTLGGIGSPLAVPTVLQALNDPDPDLVVTACDAIGQLSDAGLDEVSPPLYPLLDHSDWEVRAAACGALMDHGVCGARITETLARLAAEPEGCGSVFGLHRLEDQYAELTGRLEEFRSATYAAWLLTAREELKSPVEAVRHQALQRLGRNPDPEALGMLLEALEDPSPWIRSATPLSMSIKQSADAIPALIRHLLTDDSLHVRVMCAFRLGSHRDSRIFSPLVEALSSPDWKLVTVAIIGLRNLGDSAAAPHLIPVLDHTQWSVRRDACAALLDLGVGDPRIVRTLKQLAREPDAVEWNLSAAESVCELPMMREFAEEGDPEPQPLPTMAELIQQAETLLDTAQRPQP